MNFVFIMTDTQTKDMVGAYGLPQADTPNLDRLAAEGIRFERAYTACPLCTPARGAIFSGLHPQINGAWCNNIAPGRHVALMGEIFRHHGYRAAYTGKWHLDGTAYFGDGVPGGGFEGDWWYDGKRYAEDIGPEMFGAYRACKTADELREAGFDEEHIWGHRVADRAVDFLEKAIDYEKRTSYKYSDATFNLARMDALLAELGNPHHAMKIIHVAGTKGKGTTSAIAEACLREAGCRTGLHTQPHLVSVRERMRVDGRPAAEQEFCRLLDGARGYIERLRVECRDEAPTYFETTTALAFLHFRQQGVDWAVIEVALGGRLDATNVVLPQCCVITPIGLEHTDKLGVTVAEYAGERTGIIKKDVPVVLASQHYGEALTVLRERADQHDCPCWEVGREVSVSHMEPLSAPAQQPQASLGWRFSVQTPAGAHEDLFTPLLGAHQVENCATAIGALDLLGSRGEVSVSPEAIRDGIAHCHWPARVELLQRCPALVLDTAHTLESTRALLDAIEIHLPGRAIRMVFGCLADKNIGAMLAVLAPRCVSLVTTQADSPRAADAEDLAREARAAGMSPVRAVPSAPQAVRESLQAAGSGDVVCVMGSFYVAGAVRRAWELGELA